MRTPPIPAFPGVSHEPILHGLEAQPAPGHPAALRNLRLPARKELRPRVEHYYRQLQALPRRVRRALQRRYARSLAGVALLLALGQAPALAANIDVDGATCTVANAIRSANTDTAVGGCSAGNGADTLILVPNSTHTLTTVEDTTYGPTGLPLVTSQITIAGNDSTIERGAGAPEFRILAVGDTGNLTLEDLTLTGGVASVYFSFGLTGGGVLNFGTLSLTNSTVSGNSAIDFGGGVSNFDGTLTLIHSTISGNTTDTGRGGGVSNRDGTLTLTHSTVSGNTAFEGGGVSNYDGTLTLTNSTVSGNTANFGDGGGVRNIGFGLLTFTNSTISGNTANSGSGGGVSNRYGTLTLTNSTILGNTATFFGGGMSNGDYGTLTLIHSTVSDNSAGYDGAGVGVFFGAALALTNSTVSGNTADGSGGGVSNGGYDSAGNFHGGTLTLTRSLISGNAPNDSEAYNGTRPYHSATVVANDFNLFGTNGDAGVVGFIPGPTDIVPVAGVTLADILAPLADNGGPTQTHALVLGSPATDASPIDKDCAATDQRGVFRPQGPACDIGAFEAGVEPDPFALPTPTPGCTVNGVPDRLCQGTPGPDRIIGTLGNDVIVGLEGDDHLNGNRGDNRVFGGPGNDRIIGGRRKGDDQFFGQGGDDELRSYAGNDLLDGGDGNDRLRAHEGDDRLRGGEGDDALRGLEGNDTLEGGNGRDLLRGGPGDDRLEGGPGADRLNGGDGTDSCTSDAEDKIVVLCE